MSEGWDMSWAITHYYLICEQVFLIIKRSLKRCSALTRNQTLFNLYKVIQIFCLSQSYDSMVMIVFLSTISCGLTIAFQLNFLVVEQVFQRVLRAYAGKLVARLPRGQPGLVTGTEGQVRVQNFLRPFSWLLLHMCWCRTISECLGAVVQVSDKDERVICYIVNTAEYCHETVCLPFRLSHIWK